MKLNERLKQVEDKAGRTRVEKEGAEKVDAYAGLKLNRQAELLIGMPPVFPAQTNSKCKGLATSFVRRAILLSQAIFKIVSCRIVIMCNRVSTWLVDAIEAISLVAECTSKHGRYQNVGRVF